jgi:hypothetical protein
MTNRTATTKEPSERCEQCSRELVVIGFLVDGAKLVMRSCSSCDTRTWHLGSLPVDLDTALAAVGHSAGRRRR